MSLGASELEELCGAAEGAALVGGAIISEHFGLPRDVREKAPGDWVSETDLRSEQAVREALESAAPGIPVCGEERGGERARLGWLVDPLDGTTNFLHSFPAVAVSIALVEDGRPVVGVVHAPLLGTTFKATRGGGARRDGAALRVSVRDPEQAICATGFPFRRKDLLPGYLPVFEAALRGFEDLRRVGAASLDLCWTAEGVFDGYFEVRLGPWDVAAGALVVSEAGGVVSDWAGDDRAWLDSGDILAGSPRTHAALLGLTGSAGI